MMGGLCWHQHEAPSSGMLAIAQPCARAAAAHAAGVIGVGRPVIRVSPAVLEFPFTQPPGQVVLVA